MQHTHKRQLHTLAHRNTARTNTLVTHQHAHSHTRLLPISHLNEDNAGLCKTMPVQRGSQLSIVDWHPMSHPTHAVAKLGTEQTTACLACSLSVT
jgi:hypothetical protein